MTRRIQFKLIAILVLLVVTVMALVGTYVLASVGWFYEDSFRSEIRDVFTPELIETLRSEAVYSDAPTRMREIISAHAGRLGIGENRYFYILDGLTGEYLAGSGDMPTGGVEITPNILASMTAEEIGSGNDLTDGYFDASVPVTSGVYRYIVYVRDDKASVNELLWMLFMITVQAMLFGLVISLLLSFLLSKTISKPVENLKSGVDLMARGEFYGDLPVYGRDEIGALTRSFNSMAKVLRDTLSTVENERNKLSTLFLHMSDGVAAFAADGSVLQINPAAEEMLGIEFDESLDYDKVLAMTGVPLQTALGAVASAHLEVEYQNPDTARILKLYIASFEGENEENVSGGVLAIIHDVTEQQRLEESRREFIANVSHELRTPLTNIKSYAETILDSVVETDDSGGADGGLPPGYEQRYLEVILGETDRMTRIVKDLLTLSRLDYGKMDWKPEVYSLRNQLDHVYAAMLIDAEQHGHELKLNVAGELPEIRADRERIEQVIVNIVSNAVKYTPDGGHIEIRAGAIQGRERVFIEVEDDGIGIPSKDIPRLFERFYRVDKARSREKGGTGLGLAIAKEIIDTHGGSITVKSKPGKGTTIRVELPYRMGGEQ